MSAQAWFWFVSLTVMMAICATVFICFAVFFLLRDFYDWNQERHLKIKRRRYTNFSVGHDVKDVNGLVRHSK